MVQWSKLLKTLGFSDSEIAVYLASLELGPVPVQELSERADVSRVTTYSVIEALMQNGLMSTVERGKRQLYVAESPERLLSFARGKAHAIEASLQEMESALDELKLLQRGEKPVVKMFEGLEGLRAFRDDVIRTAPESAEEFGNLDAIYSVLTPEDLQPLRDEFTRRGVRGRFLYSSTKPFTPRQGVDVRWVPQDQIGFTGDVIVYENKVALSTFRGKLIAVIIESQELAATVRSLFELAWRASDVPKNDTPRL